jgi:hypothetical protein
LTVLALNVFAFVLVLSFSNRPVHADLELPSTPMGVELDPESVYVTRFDTERVAVNAAYRIGNQIAVEASVFGEAVMDVIVFKADAYGLADDSPIEIHDWDYNDHYAEGEARLRLEVVLETAVDDKRNVASPVMLGARPASA